METFRSFNHKIILVIIIIFFILFLKGIILLFSVYDHYDSKIYFDLVKSLVSGEGFTSHTYRTTPALFHGFMGIIMYFPSLGIYWVALLLQSFYFALSSHLFYIFLKRNKIHWSVIVIFIAGHLIFNYNSPWLMLDPPLLLFLVLSLYFKDNTILSSILFSLAILSKGFVALLLLPAVLLLYKNWKNRFLFLIFPVSVWICWVFLTNSTPIYFKQMVITHYWRYSYLGLRGLDYWNNLRNMIVDILSGIIAKPHVILSRLFSLGTLKYLIFFFGIAAFLPFISFIKKPIWLAVFIPMLFVLLISSQEGTRTPFTQYHVIMLPFLCWSSGEALFYLKIKEKYLDYIGKISLFLVLIIAILFKIDTRPTFEPLFSLQFTDQKILNCISQVKGNVISNEESSKYPLFFSESKVWWIKMDGVWINYSYLGGGKWKIEDLTKSLNYEIFSEWLAFKTSEIVERTPEIKNDYREICNLEDYKLYRLKNETFYFSLSLKYNYEK
jgi:hypothetical protein